MCRAKMYFLYLENEPFFLENVVDIINFLVSLIFCKEQFSCICIFKEVSEKRVPIILCGNKSDQRAAATAEGRRWTAHRLRFTNTCLPPLRAGRVAGSISSLGRWLFDSKW